MALLQCARSGPGRRQSLEVLRLTCEAETYSIPTRDACSTATQFSTLEAGASGSKNNIVTPIDVHPKYLLSRSVCFTINSVRPIDVH